MRKSHRRRLVIPLVVFAMVAAGGVTAGLTTLVANAQTSVSICGSSSSTPITCTGDESLTDPETISLVVQLTTGDSSSPSDQYVEVTWDGECLQGSDSADITSPTTPGEESISTTSEATVALTLPYTDPDECDFSATATLYTSSDPSSPTDTSGTFNLEVDYTSWASSSTSSASSSVDVAYISGYDSKCIDDKGNSSSNGAQVVIWGCNHGDSAQSWSWTDYELRHDGKCVNDAGYGGSGTKLILYSCNGGSNEKWSHVSGGEFKLFYTTKGQLCLDDPAYSKTNGTRLTVYTCNNGSNQHWSRS